MTSPDTANFRDAIKHLPAGGTLILTDVPWEAYEQLLAELGDGYSVRISYYRGRLEIMSPSMKHEKLKDLIQNLAVMAADEAGLALESCGSTTFKQEQLAQGVEPDTCFYIKNAARMTGKDQVDLTVDPPPDVVVEVDVSHESSFKFDLYAGMGVPEFWRYDGRRVQIYHLTGQAYSVQPASRALPALTGDVLSQFLEQAKAEGQSAARQSFRAWLRDRPTAGA
jgi:Uma2 family endonuclease